MLPQSWYDLSVTQPQDPRSLIRNAMLRTTQGVYVLSSTFIHPPSTWSASPLTLAAAPFCSSLWSDNQLAVATAAQWNFLHGTKSTDPNISPLLSNIIYMKSGDSWKMTIPLSSGATILNDVQLSFRDNAATSGEFTGVNTGMAPVLSFVGTFTGSFSLVLTLARVGRVQLALRAIDSLGNYSMFGIEAVIVP